MDFFLNYDSWSLELVATLPGDRLLLLAGFGDRFSGPLCPLYPSLLGPIRDAQVLLRWYLEFVVGITSRSYSKLVSSLEVSGKSMVVEKGRGPQFTETGSS